MSQLLLIAAIGYLLGSIPFGYILVRMFQGQDIRSRGSGNIGATNVARSSPALGILTLALDAGKGALAVCVAGPIFSRTNSDYHDASAYLVFSLVTLSAIVGHMFPVGLKFRGGKGVATAFGAFTLFLPHAILGALTVFLLVAFITRYVSLASVIAAASFPPVAWWTYQEYLGPWEILLLSVASLLVILRHRQNILRLLAGTEPRFQLRRG
ncbi:MAG: acyl-phosphate glycerol 3-phosphate acyltransferase [Acidobacteria bacterium]|nr:MAG: acyl-phosphate glycerol 3-phosphate acyltransferase [Acidobacteriota bacterium]